MLHRLIWEMSVLSSLHLLFIDCMFVATIPYYPLYVYQSIMLKQCLYPQTSTNFEYINEHQGYRRKESISSNADTVNTDEDLICPTGRHESRTNPRHYPVTGIGESVDISGDFNTNGFNELCEKDPGLLAVLAIHSAAGEFDRRTAVRQTLGRECLMQNCKHFFVVGVSPDISIHKQVIEEYKTEKDILIVPKIDKYRNLVNKVYATVKWLAEYCTKPKYVIHLNDDMFINIGLAYKVLNNQPDTNFILGHIVKGATPFRRWNSKWYVSEEEYPYKYYPSFCLGAFYAFPNVISSALLAAVPKAEFCWPDDVWFTGLVRLAAGIRIQQLHKRWTQYHHMSNIVLDENLAREMVIKNETIFIHQIKLEEYYILYNITMSQLETRRYG